MDGKSVLIVLTVFVAWFGLSRWVLPWFGVPTCMSGQCASFGPVAANMPPTSPTETVAASREENQQKPQKKERKAAAMTELHDGNFETEVLQADQPVLVDFWAPWCGPCRMVGPVVEQLAVENAGKAKVVKVNVDQSPNTAAAYGISSIPTLMIFKDGKPIDRLVGLQPKVQLQAALDRAGKTR